ncbi:ABC transporter ATP-binding protein [Pullulanibacillus camelliae]|uniref:ABC transporter ATP-binding protein n=1 Tax=Pullulanibacillus camelliae TaxID=1707096 RepID=A0A8J2YFU1_9BACL|nr:ABC transporter ATP-binding protein [Pullulanibacillus camelliae]GGE30419.1 ABC transporter ATP-binding protein [Pullulanibacillus camelliae]
MHYIILYIRQLNKHSGMILYFNLFGMGVSSLLEGAAIVLLIPLISLTGVMHLNGGTTGLVAVLDRFDVGTHVLNLPVVLGIYICIIIGQSLLQRNLSIRNVTLVQDFIHHLRLQVYQGLLQANWRLYIQQRKSDLTNLLTIEINRVNNGISLFLQLLTLIVFTGIQIGLAFYLNAKMTGFVIISGLVLSYFSRRFIRASKQLGRKTSELSKEYLAGITDQLNGMKDIKSNHLEASRLNWLRTLTKAMHAEQVEYVKLKTNSQFFYKSMSAFLLAGFVFFAVTLFHSQPGQFLIIIVIFSRLWPKVTTLQANIQQVAATIPAFKALSDLEQQCRRELEFEGEFIEEGSDRLLIKEGMECRNVYFQYESATADTLRNINTFIPANSMVAVVGRSGAGKSTLIDVLMGLLKPNRGDVLIDGKALTRETLFSLRHAMSYVPQDPFLFNGTIKDNLRLVATEATEEDLWEALRLSAADAFVRKLPEGLNTMIGDRGIKLSGGECQRLVLARALLRKPSVLVLDEATSALDTENEAKIQEALEKMRGKMTIIVIAHRLSTIRHADQVLVLDRGEIIQKGEFIQLSKDRYGVFNQLLQHQFVVS